MKYEALTLDGIDAGTWQLRSKRDPVACALADRHYSRGKVGANQVGPPGRLLVMVTPCERAVWLTHWPDPAMALDGLDAWRCTMFRNEGAGLSSDLIAAARALTRAVWEGEPAHGWLTFVDRGHVASPNPGYCFKVDGWHVDHDWQHRHLTRLRRPLG